MFCFRWSNPSLENAIESGRTCWELGTPSFRSSFQPFPSLLCVAKSAGGGPPQPVWAPKDRTVLCDAPSQASGLVQYSLLFICRTLSAESSFFRCRLRQYAMPTPMPRPYAPPPAPSPFPPPYHQPYTMVARPGSQPNFFIDGFWFLKLNPWGGGIQTFLSSILGGGVV